ncbi:unnamed protein product [Gongylonema pulchrum]|uniref:Tubulin-specific chaperone A n=1 Tax=Gongylonema pulchrum TaxID=637853 RepID=A0A183DXI7_9BILA|nr:unnamed protein product [Gongylonema pulchrum]
MVDKEKSLLGERLLRVLSAYVELKNRIYKIHREVADLKKRADELGAGLMPKMFPLTDAEKILDEKLETLRVNVESISRQLPHVSFCTGSLALSGLH